MKKPFPPRSHRSRSDGLRIAQEIAAIQAALHKHGYRTRKQPKQAAWKVFTPHPDTPPLCISHIFLNKAEARWSLIWGELLHAG